MIRAPLTALIVEDDSSWQGILTEILSDCGLKVDLTDNLAEALQKIRATPYRLAVVDLSLARQDHNNQDGLQVLKAIRRHLPGCASILLTGYASVELAVSAIQDYGAYTCLRKETFRRAEFSEIISQALASPASEMREGTDGAEVDPDMPSVRVQPADEIGSGLALVVEDDAGWRSLLTELLTDAGFQVDASASYGEALGRLKREHYQLVIADITLASSVDPEQNQDGFRLLTTIRQAEIPTIVVSGSSDPDLIDRVFNELKVFAFLEKQSFERRAFLNTLQQLAEQNALQQNLTERELEVLALVAQGLGNKEIAGKLFITTNTVKRHLKSVFAKLDVNSRAAASAYAIRMGLGVTLPGE